LIIILISISGISVAATTWDIADIFKGYFKEIAPDIQEADQGTTDKPSIKTTPNTRPLANDSSFLNTAGAVIEATDIASGLKLTARGIVGDDRAIYVAIDVETLGGEDFTKEQEDNLNSIYFQTVKLQIDDDVLGQYTGCTRIDDGTEKGKATFLISDIISYDKVDNISGHQLTITLTNLLSTTNELEDIGMEGNLYDFYTQFEKPADSDYKYYSVRSHDNHSDEENKILEQYWFDLRSGLLRGEELSKRKEDLIEVGLLKPLYLLPETSTKIKFSTKYPKLEITNMGIKNNIFTFNININDELDYQYLYTRRLVLVNRKTGSCARAIMDIDQWEGDENGKLISAHFVVFDTISSAEQLKDYYLAIGGYGTEDIIYKGQWKLNFNINYEDTSRSYYLDKKTILSDFTGTIKTIKISPLSMNLIYQTDKDMNPLNRTLFMDNWDKNKYDIYLLMKDGGKINLLSYELNIEDNILTLNALFPYIIDLGQMSKIIIADTEIVIN